MIASNVRRAVWFLPCAVAVLAISVHGAAAGASRAGTLSIVSPDADRHSIKSGDQLMQFVIEPPSGSTCPGDTQHDGWFLVGFILPADEDPTAQTFAPQGPLDRYVDGVTRRLALYRVERAPIGLVNLPLNPEAGQPVRLPAIPPLTFQQPATLGLASGRYQIGIGCLDDTTLGDYWTAVVDITRPADLRSADLSWTVVDAAPPVTAESPSNTGVYLVSVAIGVTGLAVYIAASRRSKAGRRS